MYSPTNAMLHLYHSGNMAIQYHYIGGTFVHGTLSFWGPILSLEDLWLYSSGLNFKRIRCYIWTNMIFNLVVHAVLWLMMIFVVCWGTQCITSDHNVSNKFIFYGPVTLFLHIFAFFIALVFELGIVLKQKFDVLTLQIFE